MRRRRAVVGVVLAALVLAGLAWLAYRAYAPGDFGERLDRAGKRWGAFTELTTWRFFGGGLLLTLELALVSIASSLVLGVALAVARLVDHARLRAPVPAPVARLVRLPVSATIEAVRSSPLFMLIIYVFIAAPKLGLNLSPFWAGVFALTLYTSCVLAEIVRAGILSLERGQFEAAEALGLRYGQRLRYVVLPQALRRMVPAMVSQLVTLVKDTSLVSFITVLELTRRGNSLLQGRGNPIETYLVLMAVYFLVNFALSELARRLEVRPGVVGRARVPVTIGEEDQVAAALPGR